MSQWGTDLRGITGTGGEGFRSHRWTVHDDPPRRRGRRWQVGGSCATTGLCAFSTSAPAAHPTPRGDPFGKATANLTPRQREQVEGLFARDATLQPIYDLVQAFGTMVRTRGGNDLECWLERAEQSGCSQLHAFALGLRKDREAVQAGLTDFYSQGAVEGHVHRVKYIKRSGYGRMSFPLLRQRVLSAHIS